eukprot:TRINITY_DN20847_c0_g1::TRINITY_DN20847_c0_g1_i1::g.12424::m.12424 TRINITY_DN20847_c0_g1::TRINITY_DN20847_c0_g1_i1::g.12424  ORF type:complete len:178 (+),score=38.86,sp/Q55E35/SPCS2_DICDI/34.13/4e-30,SPC25/PF06703.6/1.5e-29,Polysacc_synt/PF01943.12/0.028 TRINITY_DN20847_c0_g1_i1:57-590(+)
MAIPKDDIKVTLEDQNAIKNCLDDSVVRFVTEELTYPENTKIMDTKILVGTIAILIALVAHFYPLPWPDNRILLGICAVVYFMCSGLLQFIVSFVEKDFFFTVKSSSSIHPGLKIRSTFPRFEETYTLFAHDASGNEVKLVEKSVGNFFDTTGKFAEWRFYDELRTAFNGLNKKKQN